MAELVWSNEAGWFSIVKWACFLGVFIEACKALFSTVYLLRAGEPLHRAILLPFLQQPERLFVIGIMVYYYRLLNTASPLWLQRNPEFLFINAAYAGYWLLKAFPIFWRRGKRRSDPVLEHATSIGEPSRHPRPTPVR